MKISNYREKVMSCWLGKAAGGTLGQPYEGTNGPLKLDYYNPVPTDMIPNDDLDLQVLWACKLDAMKKPLVDRDVFADAWLNHVNFPWDEYGIAIRNLRLGIKAPYTGIYDNYFVDGLGAAIRSELWACLAPGNPELAAKYAYEDACVDHDGDGIYAEQFLAALESAAFAESDIKKLIDIGLSVIPKDSRLAKAIKDTLKWCKSSSKPLDIREKILQKWGSENFTDVVMNIPFMIMALVLGKKKFGKTICLANNCGRDADCTAATVGAILGIIDPDCIEEKWLKPIGRKLVLNAGIVGIKHPATLDEFTEMVISLKDRVALRKDTSMGKEPKYSKYEINAEIGVFGPWFALDENKFFPKMPEKTKKVKFPGTLAKIDASEIPGESLLMMKFKFKLEKDMKVRVIFNSPSNSRVWVNGVYAFGREGGRMAPAFHRSPPNQFKDFELKAGTHEIIAGVAPLVGEKEILFNIGVGDCKDFQWLPGAIL